MLESPVETTAAPTSAPGAPLPSFATLDAWLDQGLAHQVAPWLTPLLQDPRAEAGLVAVRALRQLGADRDSEALALRLGRRHPHHPDAQLAGLRALLGLYGPHTTWMALQKQPLPADASPVQRAARLSFEGYWLALLRDEGPALALQAQALALCPDDPWLWVEHSYALNHLDRFDEALAATQRALDLVPGHRTAVLQRARLLQQLGRRDEAHALLTPALASTGNAAFAWQLFTLAEDAQDPTTALDLLDQVAAGLPRADKTWHPVLASRRADACLLLHRFGEAAEHAAAVGGTGFYPQLAQRLRAPGFTPQPRVLLKLDMVQQHWMTCAPATLTALAGYWGHRADHLEVAQAICYDGTTQASERGWAEAQGFHVREWRLDWASAQALVQAGVPFALCTQHVGSGHLQAVVGVDATRGTLLVRDPSQPLHAEYEAAKLFDSQQAAGPRALLMLPPAEAHRVQDIALPEGDAWDRLYPVVAALQVHQRPRAQAAADALQAAWPDSDCSLRARRVLAMYDGDEPRILAATEALLARYPDDGTLQLSRLTSLFEVQGQAAGEAYLASLVDQPRADPLLLVRQAERLLQDGRRSEQAERVLRLALRRAGTLGRAWSAWGDLLWARHGAAAALQPVRWASTLVPTEEWAARTCARAYRVAGQPEAGVAWLTERNQVWGDRSGQPATTLAEELDQQQRDGEAEAVLAAALARRPTDHGLHLFMAERRLAQHRLADAEQHLAAAEAAPAPALLRLRASLLEAQGALDEALTVAQQAVALEPLHLPHHRLLLRLLRRRHGDTEALARWRPLVDSHPAHLGLQRLLYDALPDQADAVNAQLDHLHAHHPGDAWLQRERAIQASRQGRHDDAIALAEAALALAPGSSIGHDTLAYTRQRRDGYAAALPHMQAALRLDVENETATLRLLDAPDPVARRAGLDFIAQELQTQNLLGDGLLNLQAEAGTTWPGEDTLALLQRLRQRWPRLWQGPVAEARQLMQLQRTDAALAVLAEAAQRFPELPRVHHEQGEALRLAGRTDEALQANGRALALSPSWNRALRLQVDLLCKHQRRWADAEALLQRALQTRDGWNDDDLLGLLAWVQEGSERDDEAFETARRSLLLAPGAGWVWALARRVCERAEAPARLDALIDAVVASRPGDALAWLVRAEQGRDDRQALAAAEQAIALQPRLEAAWLARFERLQRLGRTDEITDALARLPWPAPAPLALRSWGARVDWGRGERARAVQTLRALRAEAPHDQALCLLLADWLDDTNDHPGYLVQAQELATMAPMEARSHGYLGHALVKNHRWQEALWPLQRALELAPAYTFAARQLVLAAREAGSPDLAEPALQSLWPHHPTANTAGDGIEAAAAAQQRERAFAWLARLFEVEDFDIERSRAALKALRQAGWGAELAPLQRRQLAAGGGPVGVGLDWLDQQRGGTLWVTARALRLQGASALATPARAQAPSAEDTGAPPPHHGWLALLRWLGGREARWTLRWLVWRHGAALRAHPQTWGETSYALSLVNHHAGVVAWLADWRGRDRPPAYAMANLAGSLAVRGQWAALAEVVQATLERLPNQEDMRLWQLLLLARDGQLDALDQALDRCHEWTPDRWMQPLLPATRAFSALARARGGAGTVAALQACLSPGGPPQAQAYVQALRRWALWRHTPWTRLPRWLLPAG